MLKTYLTLQKEAPHWEKGFEDTIFDAIALLEGSELEADANTYNEIIYAFARSRDAQAAEFYFWEMQVSARLGLCLSLSLSLSLRLMLLFLYTVVVLFHVDWCIRLTALVFIYHSL